LLAARDHWPALASRAAIQIDRSGAIAAGPEGWLADVRASFTRLGLHLSELPRSALDELAPGLNPTFDRALLTREDWRLDPATSLARLRTAAEAAGVAFRRERAEAPSADWLVVATGAGWDLVEIAPELAHLIPIKGHILRVAGLAAGPFSVRGRGAYAVAAEGGLAIGATMEEGVADPTVDPAQEAGLREAGSRLFPDLAKREARLLAGVRAGTPDGLPMVGFSAAPRVALAVGARRNGWLLAPLAGRIVAACIMGGDPGPFAARLDPARFAGREA